MVAKPGNCALLTDVLSAALFSQKEALERIASVLRNAATLFNHFREHVVWELKMSL